LLNVPKRAHDSFQEVTLPHSARTIAFLNHDLVCLAYSPDFVLFSLETSSVIEVTTPVTVSSSVTGYSNMGMGAFSGLGGYMTLGLGNKAKPCVVNISESEILVVKDSKL